MSFGDNLRALIEERGMTQKELARQFNLAPSTLGCYVQNTREPDFATLMMFADYFGVSADYLLGHSTGDSPQEQEEELLRVFRTLTSEQRALYLEQGKAFLRVMGKKRT